MLTQQGVGGSLLPTRQRHLNVRSRDIDGGDVHFNVGRLCGQRRGGSHGRVQPFCLLYELPVSSHLLAAYLHLHLLRSFRGANAEQRALLLDETFKVALGGLDVDDHLAGILRAADIRRRALACEIGLRGTVVVVFCKAACAAGPDFIATESLVDAGRIVVRKGEGDDGARLGEERNLPERSIETVDDAIAFVAFARKIVVPSAFGEVDAMAHIVALSVHRRILIDGSYQK